MNEYRLSDISIGLEQSFDVVLDAKMLQSFLEISGDNNPLHTEEEYAKVRGFKDKVVYGLLTSSFYSTLVGVYLPGKFAILHGIDIQFLGPVFVGDQLHVYGVIKYINEAYRQIEVKAHITNQDNKKVSKATIKIGLIDE